MEATTFIKGTAHIIAPRSASAANFCHSFMVRRVLFIEEPCSGIEDAGPSGVGRVQIGLCHAAVADLIEGLDRAHSFSGGAGETLSARPRSPDRYRAGNPMRPS
ncbi:MAG: hypothetical protein ACK515_22145 [bacterium]